MLGGTFGSHRGCGQCLVSGTLPVIAGHPASFASPERSSPPHHVTARCRRNDFGHPDDFSVLLPDGESVKVLSGLSKPGDCVGTGEYLGEGGKDTILCHLSGK